MTNFDTLVEELRIRWPARAFSITQSHDRNITTEPRLFVELDNKKFLLHGRTLKEIESELYRLEII